jgi:alpha-glutamyl/putrescinyl thymine pyrophosphorylase clade 1
MLSALLEFIAERELIRGRRAAGEPPPWTADPILREWSFTNVRREDDRVTRWITVNWREPHAKDPDLWFAMCVARFVNLPGTLAEIGFPVPWNREHFIAVMAARAARGDKLYGPAYMIHADNKNKGRCTAEYQAAEVFNPLWRAHEFLRPTHGETLARYHSRLGEIRGIGGGFMAGQVIADLKYVAPLNAAADWMTFAVSGPGSKRGLNRVLGRPVDAPWSESGWRREFDHLRTIVMPDLECIGLGGLHAQDLQSCLCELDKYERVRLGEGKPRRRFLPSREPLPVISVEDVHDVPR